jgi:hypothetical protein
MGLGDWLRLFDAASDLAKLARRVRRPELPVEGNPAGGGPMAQMETRLAGVVVAALKEAFDRDRARMDFERAHLDAERERAEQALRAELRRQAADRALAHVRTIALMTIGVWMLSAALGVWMPGMRVGAARYVLGAGWACVLGALGCAFAGWQRITIWSASETGDGSTSASLGFAERAAPWLLLLSMALVGAALLAAL